MGASRGSESWATALTARRAIGAGALLTALGLAVAGTAPVVGTAPIARVHALQTLGGAAVMAGWLLLAWGIHRFGREGRDRDGSPP